MLSGVKVTRKRSRTDPPIWAPPEMSVFDEMDEIEQFSPSGRKSSGASTVSTVLDRNRPIRAQTGVNMGSSRPRRQSGEFEHRGDSSDEQWKPPEVAKRAGMKVTNKVGKIELRVVQQPEEQHRARYMSEGSRGAIKDRSGKSHVTVQLQGYNQMAILEVFAATGSGAVAPHPLYKLIPVMGKGNQCNTPCTPVTRNGTDCIQVTLRPEEDMMSVLDCIGILKICSYKVKQTQKAPEAPYVRLAFRVSVDTGENQTVLQTVSSRILCIQQMGQPEIYRTSLDSCSSRGGKDLFVLGRNFAKDAVVLFRESDADGKLLWSAQATVQRNYLHQCHLVCTVPTYRDLSIPEPVEVSMVVQCGRKISRPLAFMYFPESHPEIQSNELHHTSSNISRSLPGPSNVISAELCSTTASYGLVQQASQVSSMITPSLQAETPTFQAEASVTTTEVLKLMDAPAESEQPRPRYQRQESRDSIVSAGFRPPSMLIRQESVDSECSQHGFQPTEAMDRSICNFLQQAAAGSNFGTQETFSVPNSPFTGLQESIAISTQQLSRLAVHSAYTTAAPSGVFTFSDMNMPCTTSASTSSWQPPSDASACLNTDPWLPNFQGDLESSDKIYAPLETVHETAEEPNAKLSRQDHYIDPNAFLNYSNAC